jgi:hypothetical protein
MLALPSTVENAGRVFPDFEEKPTRVKVHEVLLVTSLQASFGETHGLVRCTERDFVL